MNHVILSGGIYHPFAECAQWVADAVAHEATLITEQVDEAFAALEQAELFTLYALRWRMLNDPKYVPFLEEWAYTMTPAVAARLDAFLARGGSMLAMHTASICFDTWPDYARCLGGRWEWGATFHPELSAIEVEPVGDHPLVAGIEPFGLMDEVYHHLAIEPDSVPLLRARVAPAAGPKGPWHTVAWACEPGAGRVVYNALGHSVASLREPMHTKFLRNSLAWLGKLTNV